MLLLQGRSYRRENIIKEIFQKIKEKIKEGYGFDEGKEREDSKLYFGKAMKKAMKLN